LDLRNIIRDVPDFPKPGILFKDITPVMENPDAGLDMDKPLVLMRKAGKLPAETRSVTYDLEYGQATLEMHVDSLNPGDRVIIVDDLLATGGTAVAAAQLVTDAGGIVAGFLFMVELDFLAGRAKLEGLGPVFSLVNYS